MCRSMVDIQSATAEMIRRGIKKKKETTGQKYNAAFATQGGHKKSFSANIIIMLLPAALRGAQICRYLVYSEADFEVFRPAGATRCTNGGEIWQGGLLHAKFHPHQCNDKGVGPPKLRFLLRFDRNVEYKRPAGAYPLRDFHKICRVCTSFRVRWVLKYGWICSRGYGVMRVLS